MKNIFIAALCLALAGCGTITSEKSGRYTRLVYKANAPEALTDNSKLTSYYRHEMESRAAQACPGGYQKVKEGHVIKKPDGSFYYWDIACL